MSVETANSKKSSRIVDVPVQKINPAPYNPRVQLTPDDREYHQLAESIDTYGLVEPLVYNERTGNLVGGHQRFSILVARGLTEIPCIVVDLNGADERGLNLALNKLEGQWDVPRLLAYLNDQEIPFTGFSRKDIEDISWSLRDGVFRVALTNRQLRIVVEAIDRVRMNDDWAESPPRAIYRIAQWYRGVWPDGDDDE